MLRAHWQEPGPVDEAGHGRSLSVTLRACGSAQWAFEHEICPVYKPSRIDMTHPTHFDSTMMFARLLMYLMQRLFDEAMS
jgi:hypothetical protein